MACLTCYAVDNTSSSSSSSSHKLHHHRSSGSSSEGCCRGMVAGGCWFMKIHSSLAPLPPSEPSPSVRARVAPTPSPEIQTPRLLRCHAARRDLYRDFDFEQVLEGQ